MHPDHRLLAKPALRRGPLLPLAAAALFALAPPPAEADIAYWGSLPTADGSRIYQWHVADWIARAFNDGNTGDNEVNTSITMFFTQCFGGDWLASFNASAFEAQPYGLYDRWRFNEATVASADVAGDLSYYNGYHRSAAAAFSPWTTIGGVHAEGVLGADTRELPQIEGVNRIIGVPLGFAQTHVLAYAGQPESLDWDDLADIHRATEGRDGVSAVFLSGSGYPPSDGRMDGADLRAATRSQLEAAIFDIGAQLRAGTLDSFSLFVTDHGGLATVEVSPAALDPGALRRLVLPFTGGQRDGAAANGSLEFEFATAQVLSLDDLKNIRLTLNGQSLTLEESSVYRVSGLDPAGGIAPTLVNTYRVRLDASFANLVRPNAAGAYEQVLELSNGNGWLLGLDWIALSPGDVLRPEGVPAIPEPGTWGLMAAGGLFLHALARRRTRAVAKGL